LHSVVTVSNSNIPPSSPTIHLELTSALILFYAVLISKPTMTIQNFHENSLLSTPRRRSTKLSRRMESFQHCSCAVLCRDFGLSTLTLAFSRTLSVSAVWLLHDLNTRGLCIVSVYSGFCERGCRQLLTDSATLASICFCGVERKYCGPLAILNLSEDGTQSNPKCGS
jgi:hypothetical protein